MTEEMIPELERLKAQLDDLALARGWNTDGYFFDGSPFDGVHLVKDEDVWKLYWKEPGIFFVERKFIHLADAYREMVKTVTAMKQREGLEAVGEAEKGAIPPDAADIEMSNTPEPEELDEPDDQPTAWDLFVHRMYSMAVMLPVMMIIVFLILMVIGAISGRGR